MPMTVNGFGTSVCGRRGDIGWGSFDAMEWFTAFYMPILPIKAVHTFDWQGEQYRMIPIRWSLELVFRTFFLRWAWGLGIVGVVLFFIGFIEKAGDVIPLFISGAVLLILAIIIAVALVLSDRRHKNIRLVMGPMTIGNCDPVNLPQRMLEDMAADTQVAYGTSSYAKAAQKLMEKGSYARAMWAARMATALEDGPGGETLTNEILADVDVKDGIERVRRKASLWAEYMTLPEEHTEAAEEEVEDIPVVEDNPEERKRKPDDRYR